MPYIVTSACILCGACVAGCESDAISEGDLQAIIDPAICIECGTCASNCPSGAIEMIECRPEDAQTKTGFRPVCHFDRCILCGQCVESCPRDVLALSGEFEMAYLSRADMIIE